MLRGLRAYLAGPDVFLPDAVQIGRLKVRSCAAIGIEGQFPLDNEVEKDASPRQTALTISRLNEDMIARCDVVLANLTPFRSPSVDPGTAFEIGYARARGMRIYGYSAASGALIERTRRFLDIGDQGAVDAAGCAIENFGLHDNLMIDGAIESSGGFIVSVEERSLAAFVAFEMLIARLANDVSSMMELRAAAR